MAVAPLRVLRFDVFGCLWRVFGRFWGIVAPYEDWRYMKCCCECHCSEIPSHEAMNDRIYWIEINSGVFKGTRCAAWRTGRDPNYPWVADLDPAVELGGITHEGFIDSAVTVVYEIIPEE